MRTACSQNPLRVPENLIWMRTDMRMLFDHLIFAIVPKRDPALSSVPQEQTPSFPTQSAADVEQSTQAASSQSTPGPQPAHPDQQKPPPRYVLHIFGGTSDSFFDQHYHNREIQPFAHAPEFLLARFARTIFSSQCLSAFLASGGFEQRTVFAYEGGKLQREFRTAEQCAAILQCMRGEPDEEEVDGEEDDEEEEECRGRSKT